MPTAIKKASDKSVRDNTQKVVLYDNRIIEIISMNGRKKVYSYFIPLGGYINYIAAPGNMEYLKREYLLKFLNSQNIVSKGLFDESNPLHSRILDSQIYAIDKII